MSEPTMRDAVELIAIKNAEIAWLREALTPFAEAHFYYSDAGKPDDCRTGIGGVTYGDFRRAVSVLAAHPGSPPPDPELGCDDAEFGMSDPVRLNDTPDPAEAMRAKCFDVVAVEMEAWREAGHTDDGELYAQAIAALGVLKPISERIAALKGAPQ